jgi:hypothetical protein
MTDEIEKYPCGECNRDSSPEKCGNGKSVPLLAEECCEKFEPIPVPKLEPDHQADLDTLPVGKIEVPWNQRVREFSQKAWQAIRAGVLRADMENKPTDWWGEWGKKVTAFISNIAIIVAKCK